MGLSYDGTITLASGNNIWCGATDETNHRIVVIADESPTKIQVWDMVTRTQVGSDITASLTSGMKGIVVVGSGASAIVMGTGTSNAQIVELPGGYVTTGTGGNTMPSLARKGQNGAVDTTNRNALFISSSSRTMSKVAYTAGGTLTVSSITVPFLANVEANCIIYKSSDRFIIGTEQGGIYEIDSSGNVYNTISIGQNYDPYHLSGSGSIVASNIYAMAYDNGILLAVTSEGVLYKIAYDTQTILNRIQLYNGVQLSLSNSYNGTSLIGINTAVSSTLDNPVRYCDFTCSQNSKVTDLFYAQDHGEIIDMGIDTSNGKAWIIQDQASGTGADLIHIISLTPRASTTRTFTIQDNSVHQRCRLLLLDDTDTDKKLITDILIQSPATFRVPTGKTVKEIIKANDGITAKWGYGEYST